MNANCADYAHLLVLKSESDMSSTMEKDISNGHIANQPTGLSKTDAKKGQDSSQVEGNQRQSREMTMASWKYLACVSSTADNASPLTSNCLDVPSEAYDKCETRGLKLTFRRRSTDKTSQPQSQREQVVTFHKDIPKLVVQKCKCSQGYSLQNGTSENQCKCKQTVSGGQPKLESELHNLSVAPEALVTSQANFNQAGAPDEETQFALTTSAPTSASCSKSSQDNEPGDSTTKKNREARETQTSSETVQLVTFKTSAPEMGNSANDRKCGKSEESSFGKDRNAMKAGQSDASKILQKYATSEESHYLNESEGDVRIRADALQAGSVSDNTSKRWPSCPKCTQGKSTCGYCGHRFSCTACKCQMPVCHEQLKQDIYKLERKLEELGQMRDLGQKCSRGVEQASEDCLQESDHILSHSKRRHLSAPTELGAEVKRSESAPPPVSKVLTKLMIPASSENSQCFNLDLSGDDSLSNSTYPKRPKSSPPMCSTMEPREGTVHSKRPVVLLDRLPSPVIELYSIQSLIGYNAYLSSDLSDYDQKDETSDDDTSAAWSAISDYDSDTGTKSSGKLKFTYKKVSNRKKYRMRSKRKTVSRGHFGKSRVQNEDENHDSGDELYRLQKSPNKALRGRKRVVRASRRAVDLNNANDAYIKCHEDNEDMFETNADLHNVTRFHKKVKKNVGKSKKHGTTKSTRPFSTDSVSNNQRKRRIEVGGEEVEDEGKDPQSSRFDLVDPRIKSMSTALLHACHKNESAEKIAFRGKQGPKVARKRKMFKQQSLSTSQTVDKSCRLVESIRRHFCRPSGGNNKLRSSWRELKRRQTLTRRSLLYSKSPVNSNSDRTCCVDNTTLSPNSCRRQKQVKLSECKYRNVFESDVFKWCQSGLENRLWPGADVSHQTLASTCERKFQKQRWLSCTETGEETLASEAAVPRGKCPCRCQNPGKPFVQEEPFYSQPSKAQDRALTWRQVNKAQEMLKVTDDILEKKNKMKTEENSGNESTFLPPTSLIKRECQSPSSKEEAKSETEKLECLLTTIKTEVTKDTDLMALDYSVAAHTCRSLCPEMCHEPAQEKDCKKKKRSLLDGRAPLLHKPGKPVKMSTSCKQTIMSRLSDSRSKSTLVQEVRKAKLLNATISAQTSLPQQGQQSLLWNDVSFPGCTSASSIVTPLYLFTNHQTCTESSSTYSRAGYPLPTTLPALTLHTPLSIQIGHSPANSEYGSPPNLTEYSSPSCFPCQAPDNHSSGSRDSSYGTGEQFRTYPFHSRTASSKGTAGDGKSPRLLFTSEASMSVGSMSIPTITLSSPGSVAKGELLNPSTHSPLSSCFISPDLPRHLKSASRTSSPFRSATNLSPYKMSSKALSDCHYKPVSGNSLRQNPDMSNDNSKSHILFSPDCPRTASLKTSHLQCRHGEGYESEDSDATLVYPPADTESRLTHSKAGIQSRRSSLGLSSVGYSEGSCGSALSSPSLRSDEQTITEMDKKRSELSVIVSDLRETISKTKAMKKSRRRNSFSGKNHVLLTDSDMASTRGMIRKPSFERFMSVEASMDIDTPYARMRQSIDCTEEDTEMLRFVSGLPFKERPGALKDGSGSPVSCAETQIYGLAERNESENNGEEENAGQTAAMDERSTAYSKLPVPEEKDQNFCPPDDSDSEDRPLVVIENAESEVVIEGEEALHKVSAGTYKLPTGKVKRSRTRRSKSRSSFQRLKICMKALFTRQVTSSSKSSFRKAGHRMREKKTASNSGQCDSGQSKQRHRRDSLVRNKSEKDDKPGETKCKPNPSQATESADISGLTSLTTPKRRRKQTDNPSSGLNKPDTTDVFTDQLQQSSAARILQELPRYNWLEQKILQRNAYNQSPGSATAASPQGQTTRVSLNKGPSSPAASTNPKCFFSQDKESISVQTHSEGDNDGPVAEKSDSLGPDLLSSSFPSVKTMPELIPVTACNGAVMSTANNTGAAGQMAGTSNEPFKLELPAVESDKELGGFDLNIPSPDDGIEEHSLTIDLSQSDEQETIHGKDTNTDDSTGPSDNMLQNDQESALRDDGLDQRKTMNEHKLLSTSRSILPLAINTSSNSITTTSTFCSLHKHQFQQQAVSLSIRDMTKSPPSFASSVIAGNVPDTNSLFLAAPLPSGTGQLVCATAQAPRSISTQAPHSISTQAIMTSETVVLSHKDVIKKETPSCPRVCQSDSGRSQAETSSSFWTVEKADCDSVIIKPCPLPDKAAVTTASPTICNDSGVAHNITTTPTTTVSPAVASGSTAIVFSSKPAWSGDCETLTPLDLCLKKLESLATTRTKGNPPVQMVLPQVQHKQSTNTGQTGNMPVPQAIVDSKVILKSSGQALQQLSNTLDSTNSEGSAAGLLTTKSHHLTSMSLESDLKVERCYPESLDLCVKTSDVIRPPVADTRPDTVAHQRHLHTIEASENSVVDESLTIGLALSAELETETDKDRSGLLNVTDTSITAFSQSNDVSLSSDLALTDVAMTPPYQNSKSMTDAELDQEFQKHLIEFKALEKLAERKAQEQMQVALMRKRKAEQLRLMELKKAKRDLDRASNLSSEVRDVGLSTSTLSTSTTSISVLSSVVLGTSSSTATQITDPSVSNLLSSASKAFLTSSVTTLSTLACSDSSSLESEKWIKPLENQSNTKEEQTIDSTNIKPLDLAAHLTSQIKMEINDSEETETEALGQTVLVQEDVTPKVNCKHEIIETDKSGGQSTTLISTINSVQKLDILTTLAESSELKDPVKESSTFENQKLKSEPQSTKLTYSVSMSFSTSDCQTPRAPAPAHQSPRVTLPVDKLDSSSINAAYVQGPYHRRNVAILEPPYVGKEVPKDDHPQKAHNQRPFQTPGNLIVPVTGMFPSPSASTSVTTQSSSSGSVAQLGAFVRTSHSNAFVNSQSSFRTIAPRPSGSGSAGANGKTLDRCSSHPEAVLESAASSVCDPMLIRSQRKSLDESDFRDQSQTDVRPVLDSGPRSADQVSKVQQVFSTYEPMDDRRPYQRSDRSSGPPLGLEQQSSQQLRALQQTLTGPMCSIMQVNDRPTYPTEEEDKKSAFKVHVRPQSNLVLDLTEDDSSKPASLDKSGTSNPPAHFHQPPQVNPQFCLDDSMQYGARLDASIGRTQTLTTNTFKPGPLGSETASSHFSEYRLLQEKANALPNGFNNDRARPGGFLINRHRLPAREPARPVPIKDATFIKDQVRPSISSVTQHRQRYMSSAILPEPHVTLSAPTVLNTAYPKPGEDLSPRFPSHAATVLWSEEQPLTADYLTSNLSNSWRVPSPSWPAATKEILNDLDAGSRMLVEDLEKQRMRGDLHPAFHKRTDLVYKQQKQLEMDMVIGYPQQSLGATPNHPPTMPQTSIHSSGSSLSQPAMINQGFQQRPSHPGTQSLHETFVRTQMQQNQQMQQQKPLRQRSPLDTTPQTWKSYGNIEATNMSTAAVGQARSSYPANPQLTSGQSVQQDALAYQKMHQQQHQHLQQHQYHLHPIHHGRPSHNKSIATPPGASANPRMSLAQPPHVSQPLAPPQLMFGECSRSPPYANMSPTATQNASIIMSHKWNPHHNRPMEADPRAMIQQRPALKPPMYDQRSRATAQAPPAPQQQPLSMTSSAVPLSHLQGLSRPVGTYGPMTITPNHSTGSTNSLCRVCGKVAVFLCSSCRRVWYCNQQCQTKHWGVHAAECKPAT